MAIVLTVAALDDLFGETIGLLRELGIDISEPDRAPTGVSNKLSHLSTKGGLALEAADLRLHDLCVALRNAITHHGARQRAPAAAWRRLQAGEQAWWANAASRPLPLAVSDSSPLSVDDRELIGMLKACDRVALAVNDGVRARVPDEDWIRLVFEEYRALVPYRAGDKALRPPLVTRHARTWWRLTLNEEQVRDVLG
jgi:hypothetical protein